VIEWLVFLISVAPFIELRGAIPLAIAAGYDPVSVFIICVVLNLLIIPIAFVMLDFILPPIRRRVKFVDHIFGWFVKRARKHQRLSLVGLAAGIDRKRAALAIAAGVVIAGIIIWVLATLGIIWIRGVSL